MHLIILSKQFLETRVNRIRKNTTTPLSVILTVSECQPECQWLGLSFTCDNINSFDSNPFFLPKKYIEPCDNMSSMRKLYRRFLYILCIFSDKTYRS